MTIHRVILVFVCLSIYLCVCLDVGACGDQKRTLGVLSHSLFSPLRQAPSLKLELMFVCLSVCFLVKLKACKPQRLPCPSFPWSWGYRCAPDGCYTDARLIPASRLLSKGFFSF